MADESKLRSIELFAGCGGMSLGFHSENYELVFANELSPMAAETFAFNLLNEDLREKGQKQEKSENKRAFLSVRFDSNGSLIIANPKIIQV